MEEIDIIELLKRVREGKAPKLIEIENEKYSFYENYAMLEEVYEYIEQDKFWCIDTIEFGTKIKILDKPTIEELDYSLEELEETSYNESWLMNCIRDNKEKINEIIRYLRSKDER